MKPEEALALLDQAVSQLTASREIHFRLQQAVQILKEALTPKEDENKQ